MKSKIRRSLKYHRHIYNVDTTMSQMHFFAHCEGCNLFTERFYQFKEGALEYEL